MKSSYKKLGQFIKEVSVKNKGLRVELLLGVSITKQFIPSIANTVGTDMSKYKIVKRHQFAYGPVTSRNGEKISVALLTEEECLVSTSYTVFEVIDTEELDPEYLMMWFSRSEFDRYARYMSHGTVRELFDWEEMCEVELPVPSIEKQCEIVREYNVVNDRIALNEKLMQKAASGKGKKNKKRNREIEEAKNTAPDDFKVDVQDNRFNKLLAGDSRFGIDPTSSEFKETQGMRDILSAQRKMRKTAPKATPSQKVNETVVKSSHGIDVAAIKRNFASKGKASRRG